MEIEFNKLVTIKRLTKDIKNSNIDSDSLIDSYPYFIQYFKSLNKITKHDLVIGINFVYGWMPKMFHFRKGDIEEVLCILNDVKKGTIPDEFQLEVLKEMFNNSLVGTSKLLHFINPEKCIIWDSKMYKYVTGEVAHSYRIGDCKTYLLFLRHIFKIVERKSFENIYKNICKKKGYEMTKIRAVELLMYSIGKDLK